MAKFSEIVASDQSAVAAKTAALDALAVATSAQATSHQAVLDALAKVGGTAAVVAGDHVDVYILQTPPTDFEVHSVPADPEV